MTSELWHRKGLFVTPQGDGWHSHAQIPTVLPLSDRLWRIYFGARDAANRSRVMAVDVDPVCDMAIRQWHNAPLLAASGPGRFYCDGNAPSSILQETDRYLLYFTGIQQTPGAAYNTRIGLARGDDGLRFSVLPYPVSVTTNDDQSFVSVPFVLPVGDGYRMWYVTGYGSPEDFRYSIRTCASDDPHIWASGSVPAVVPHGLYAALTRPWVTDWRGQRRLWFSERGDDFRKGGSHPYRLSWCPIDERGIASGPATPVAYANPPRPGDFDDWMQAYAAVMPHGDRLIMVYNGNEFGRDGIGWAVLGKVSAGD
ncbi:hypothetical protein [Thalassovita aquimarina]|uniref:Uncharacterized protein n=1 Tax=Thalassovita aquimarina TaxID=2785917 RepID=A0ABS5HWJ8_9RHOB|nr:hypothetical protein [Thalassovita aquimarina]MBR9653346.1 hypothetical protein [Thalassovita aquimarina]